MNVTGIRPYEAVGLYSNRIENAEALAKAVVIEAGEYLDDGSQAGNLRGENSSYVSEFTPRQNETSFDFAQRYDPAARYNLKGSESDLASLDYVNEVPKAHRDEVLRQYQMFVGSKSAEQEQTESQNTGRAMENFVL